MTTLYFVYDMSNKNKPVLVGCYDDLNKFWNDLITNGRVECKKFMVNVGRLNSTAVGGWQTIVQRDT